MPAEPDQPSTNFQSSLLCCVSQTDENVEFFRKVEMGWLDVMLSAVWDQAMAGEVNRSWPYSGSSIPAASSSTKP